jgi:nitrate/nitrite-specific signal transduction histidine kinase
MAEIEELSGDYLEAFRSYRMAYAIRDNSKYIDYIEKCFQSAFKNKKYKKSKEFKTLKKEYKGFIMKYSSTN